MKEKYKGLDMEIIEFDRDDVIVTSPVDDMGKDDVELEE